MSDWKKLPGLFREHELGEVVVGDIFSDWNAQPAAGELWELWYRPHDDAGRVEPTETHRPYCNHWSGQERCEVCGMGCFCRRAGVGNGWECGSAGRPVAQHHQCGCGCHRSPEGR